MAKEKDDKDLRTRDFVKEMETYARQNGYSRDTALDQLISEREEKHCHKAKELIIMLKNGSIDLPVFPVEAEECCHYENELV